MTERAQYCINTGYLILAMAGWKLIVEVMEILFSIFSYIYSNRKGYREYRGSFLYGSEKPSAVCLKPHTFVLQGLAYLG